MIHTKEELDALCYAERHAFLNYKEIKGRRILDVGCGDGRFTLQHFGDAAVVYGLDTKQDEIDSANESLQELSYSQQEQFHFDCADIVSYPLAEASFDIVMFLRSF